MKGDAHPNWPGMAIGSLYDHKPMRPATNCELVNAVKTNDVTMLGDHLHKMV